MREIKFRVWFENLGVMRYDNFGGNTEDMNILLKEFQTKQKLMQYTGLLDKNGKEIWEGDIVKEVFGKDNELYWTFEIKFGQYDNGGSYDDAVRGCGFYAERKEKHLSDLSDVSDFEVIGNIYQHSHLLN